MPRVPVPYRALLAAALILAPITGQAASADRASPTVVELFTSQGCSSCPPANANLASISERPGVLALSFGVTYWDRLGWKDVFARPAYTTRQETYERPLGQDGPFTPQMVVDGRTSLVGNRRAEVDAAIAAARQPAGAPTVSLSHGTATIAGGAVPQVPADVWLVRYDPRAVEVRVARGENAGRTLPHKNVVHDLLRLGRWSGPRASFAVSPARAGLRTAILVQLPTGGRILAAATD